ncbi:MAG: [Fe-S]-binding protein [Deltaproteobacteria bacterium HGW-Deltaproteobacteria-21]|nr:MAG: [Fe-S]-binding protein [Deltaproteobacteria bacterium HGW-Deltaproteobacteria-21]
MNRNEKEEVHAGGDRWIRRLEIVLDPPRLGENTADMDRLFRGIRKALGVRDLSAGLSLIRRIPRILRETKYRVEVLLCEEEMGSWRLMDVGPSGRKKTLYGLAVDLGTSTVVVRLVDLESGEVRDEVSFLNAQTEIGLDILTRIHYAGREGGLNRLQDLVVTTLNKEISLLARKHTFAREEIACIVVAGNTTMSHLLLGLDPYWICREPYIPAVNSPPMLRAADVGIRLHPEARILVFPNVGSYFGGDLIAGILASGMTGNEELSILVDVGTNAEIAIGTKDWIVACAGAAGPALEGGVADMGMMAGPGAIDSVRINASGEIAVRTIQNKPPVGICGSGLIDLIAQLYLTGMIDVRGRFVPEKCGARLRETDDGMQSLLIVPSNASGSGQDLVLSQTDIDGLLRSKAAMYTILTTVTRLINVSMEDFRSFYISGTFGSYIDPRSAIAIGMVPDIPLERYKPLGNTSLAGAMEVLLSRNAREEIQTIRSTITYIELNVNQEFMNLFSAARFIPHTDRSLFPSVKG